MLLSSRHSSLGWGNRRDMALAWMEHGESPGHQGPTAPSWDGTLEEPGSPLSILGWSTSRDTAPQCSLSTLTQGTRRTCCFPVLPLHPGTSMGRDPGPQYSVACPRLGLRHSGCPCAGLSQEEQWELGTELWLVPAGTARAGTSPQSQWVFNRSRTGGDGVCRRSEESALLFPY